MHRRVMPVLVLALVAVALLGGAAYGEILPETTEYTEPEQCYTCHQGSGAAVTRADFSVAGPVNYEKCNACHTGMPRVGHYHFGFPIEQCSGCHGVTRFDLNLPPDATATTGPAFTALSPDGSITYGLFVDSLSLASGAARLHSLHSGQGWVEREYGDTLFGRTRIECAQCHAAAACTACHDAPPASHGDHAVSEYPAVSTKQATGTAVTYTASTCTNPACHDIAKAGTDGFTPECGSCHESKTTPHGYVDVDHVAADGDLNGTACSSCHALDLATAHGDATAIGTSCATCHPAPRDSFGAWDQSCATGGCHTDSSTAPMHADMDQAHTVATANTVCLDCHPEADLVSLHLGAADETGNVSCLVCHTGVVGEPVTNDCTTCHFTFEEHYGDERHTSSWAPLVSCAGVGCHDISGDLMTVHQEKDPTFTCAGCHSDFSVAGQIEQGLTGCGDCHDSIYQTSSHTDAHMMTPSLADGVYAYGSDGTPSVPVTDCAGCHLSNLAYEHMGIASLGRLPRYSSAGEALTCATCHSSTDPTVLAAIDAGSLACTGCHGIHEPQTAAHASTFVENPQVDCSQCHSDQLETEHSDLAVTTSAGRTLTGCAVCHDYWTTDGPLGVTVQAAIEGDDQILCTACHAAQHPDFGSHTVDSPESLACAVCHDEGGSTVVDVQAIHADADGGACAVCHSNASRVGDLSALTAECTSCHATEGTDYHRGLPAAHTYTAIDATCVGAGCHVANTLPEEHERFLEGTGYSTSCALCHDNADPARIDWATATAACDTCHDVHGDIDALHSPETDEACVGCHGDVNVLTLHVDETTGESACGACHDGVTVLPSPLTCAGCHPVEGVDYHSQMDAAHTSGAMDASCTGAGCHAANTLPEEHERFLGRYTEYSTTCELCHENSDPARIDFSTATAACDSCHDVHGDIGVVHTATASQGCVDCHETGDALALHLTPLGETDCALCHAAAPDRIDWDVATIECASCHGLLQPVATNHYPVTAHRAVTERGCPYCHSMDLKTEHFKPTVAVGCVQCHETYVDSFTAPWDKTCDACHPGRHQGRRR